ncbi:MAG: hypothetical protein ACI9QQ_000725, partial [Myxococcota bacterium]
HGVVQFALPTLQQSFVQLLCNCVPRKSTSQSVNLGRATGSLGMGSMLLRSMSGAIGVEYRQRPRVFKYAQRDSELPRACATNKKRMIFGRPREGI